MDKNQFNSRWSQLHGGANITGATKGWLSISYPMAQFLSQLKITPNILTLSTIVLSLPILFDPKSSWFLLIAIIAFLSDGLDGSLAIFTQSESRWGAILDSWADRITEAFWMWALYLRFLPFFHSHATLLSLLSAVWLGSVIQEYMRARAQGLGVKEISIVTVMERPVRAIVTFIFIGALPPVFLHLVSGSSFHWFTHSGNFFLIFLMLMLSFQCAALFQLARKYYRQLSNPQSL